MTSTVSTRTVTVDAVTGPVPVTFTERGEGRPFLLLHGGAGPVSVEKFADLLAGAEPARVIVPLHPGFGGTPRPEGLASIAGLAAVYGQLLEDLDLAGVTVVGNSIGGWIAAEIALLGRPRVSGVVLVDAAGLKLDAEPAADFFSLTMDQVFELSFHNPDPFRFNAATLPPAAQAVAAGNRAAIAVYAGAAMTDPTLAARLGTLEVPTLVLWGESDGIVDSDYGRAYAAAIPLARFQLLPATGHNAQMETPDQVVDAIWGSGDTDFSAFAR